MVFSEPKTHWQGEGDGGAVSELPIINYTVAFLWKQFGKSEGLYRCFNYAIFILGIFVLFKTLVQKTHYTWLSFFWVSCLLTSPLLVYYSFNFLADVPALIMAIMSFCLLLKAHDGGGKPTLYLSLITGTLAALLKASDAVIILLISLLFILEITGLTKKLGIKTIFGGVWWPFLALALSITAIVTWYSFAKDYNTLHKSALFLVGILPIWEMDTPAVMLNLSALLADKFAIFLNRPMLLLFVLMNVYIWFNFRLLEPILKLSYCIVGVFFIIYILLFFKVFDNHDYYLTNLMIFPVVNFFCLGMILRSKNWSISLNKWVMTAIILLVVFNGLYAAAFYRSRTIKGDKLCYWYPFLTPIEKDIAEYQAWTYEQNMNILEMVGPKLRELGVGRDELVISIPDFSPNNSLYIFDQKGYTVSSGDFMNGTNWMTYARYKRCKYLIISDTIVKKSGSFDLIKKDMDLLFKQTQLEIYKLKQVP